MIKLQAKKESIDVGRVGSFPEELSCFLSVIEVSIASIGGPAIIGVGSYR